MTSWREEGQTRAAPAENISELQLEHRTTVSKTIRAYLIHITVSTGNPGLWRAEGGRDFSHTWRKSVDAEG